MIITLSHQKGGVGKSTLAWNLIVEFSKKRKVSVIDLDMQKTITYSLQIRKNKLGQGGVNNIALLDPKSDIEMVEMMLTNQRSKEDLMIIDSGGFDSSSNRIAITGSDILLTPVSTKFYEILGLKEYSKILDKINHEVRSKHKQELVANVILNKINPNTIDLEDMKNFVESDKNFALMKSIIRQRVDYENSPGVGSGVVEYNNKGRAAAEFKDFIKELNIIIAS